MSETPPELQADTAQGGAAYMQVVVAGAPLKRAWACLRDGSAPKSSELIYCPPAASFGALMRSPLPTPLPRPGGQPVPGLERLERRAASSAYSVSAVSPAPL